MLVARQLTEAIYFHSWTNEKKNKTLWKSIGAVVKDPLEGSCSERTQVQFIQTITYNRIIKQRMTWHETKLWTWTHTTELTGNNI